MKKNYRPEEPIVDMEYLNQATGRDVAFGKELFIVFSNTAKDSFQKMEKALLANDNEGWSNAAHSLKSSCGAIGAFSMADVLEYAQTHPKDDNETKKIVLSDVKIGLDKVYEVIAKALK